MLFFDTRSIEAGAQSVDGVVESADAVWTDGDVRPEGSVAVSGRLSVGGPGRYYFAGHLEGTAVVSCRRCLSEVQVTVNDAMSALFAEPGLDESEEDDVCPLPSGARTIDLRPAIREAWVLAVPSFATCRADCAGLCPNCGADRNVVSCSCQSTSVDARWDVLRALRDSGS